jgi:hypothetical protein
MGGASASQAFARFPRAAPGGRRHTITQPQSNHRGGRVPKINQFLVRTFQPQQAKFHQ